MKHKLTRAQSLVEYALILGLVALAVIVIAFALGLGLQRVYGLIVGALGENGHGSSSSVQHSITIDTALCIAVASQHQTGLWVLGQTDEPDLSTIHGSTEFGISVIGPYQGGYAYHPFIDTNKADVSECPASVVIQAQDGTIAVAPLQKMNE
ncbi:MAG: Flp family type IVb pilin [Aggregatilineales bacterium]